MKHYKVKLSVKLFEVFAENFDPILINDIILEKGIDPQKVGEAQDVKIKQEFSFATSNIQNTGIRIKPKVELLVSNPIWIIASQRRFLRYPCTQKVLFGEVVARENTNYQLYTNGRKYGFLVLK